MRASPFSATVELTIPSAFKLHQCSFCSSHAISARSLYYLFLFFRVLFHSLLVLLGSLIFFISSFNFSIPMDSVLLFFSISKCCCRDKLRHNRIFCFFYFVHISVLRFISSQLTCHHNGPKIFTLI